MSGQEQGLSSFAESVIRKGLFAAVESKRTDLTPQILDVLKKRREPSIVSRAAWALGRLGYREAIPDLLPLLGSNNEEVRSWGAWALGEFGNSDLERPLRTALERERSDKVKRMIRRGLKEDSAGPNEGF